VEFRKPVNSVPLKISPEANDFRSGCMQLETLAQSIRAKGHPDCTAMALQLTAKARGLISTYSLDIPDHLAQPLAKAYFEQVKAEAEQAAADAKEAEAQAKAKKSRRSKKSNPGGAEQEETVNAQPVYLRPGGDSGYLTNHLTSHLREHIDLGYEAARAFIELKYLMDEHSVTVENLVELVPHYHKVMDVWRNQQTRFEGQHVGTEGNNRRSNTTRDDRPPRSRKSYG
jgi:hypothetical protein